MPEGTKELLLIHFEEIGHLHKFSVEMNAEQIECYKITDDAYPVKGGFYVSDKERATMLLQLNVEQISQKLEILAQKIFSSHEEASKLLKVKRKNKAKLMLRQEHTYHNYWESFAVLKHQLENQLSKIDALEGNQSLETTFKLAEAAHKSIKTDLKEVEEVLKNIDMRMEEQDDINPQVQNSSDDEILKELSEFNEEDRDINKSRDFESGSECKSANETGKFKEEYCEDWSERA
eukprot:TRINITY_DN4100_c0_g2_i3.p1 TRINITY_DN4100_c0_g2~~TRINITY_DN4100_c0_g2_i3.p1  ORF type:complete len:234 (-),score=88.82 TRINITY_DN4100_c0_g2_i3:9-710(-)